MERDLRENKVGAAGFSLLELMIVLAIIAILAAVAVPPYYSHILRSRQSQAIGDMMAIKAAQERYFAENGGYALSINRLDAYYVAGNTYTHGYYSYWIVSSSADQYLTGTTTYLTGGTISALGDINKDGSACDGWQMPINSINDKPKPFSPPSPCPSEGFSWSSLGNLF